MKTLFLFCLALFVGGCATTSTAVIDTGVRYSANASQVEDYRLASGDKVRLTVFNEPTLSGEFSVSASGSLSLPLIGDVDVNGRPTTEVANVVRTRLAAGYLREPKVNIEVITYRPFFILGEVKSPGQYPYASGLTVLNAVAVGQGFTPRAARATVYIRRSGATTEEAYRLTPELRVWPGDTVRVGERYF